ncbi:MAG TPA: pseudouridine synthase [Candidatus Saccharimonadales bacterium]|nr:pseudouridine synthase [Candidatus Saccharimonadales bacterium]
MRLQKYLSEAGVASRRASEQIILAGRVTVNGQIVRLLGTKVQPGKDEVVVDGRIAKPRRKLYVALHKPAGYVCSKNDPEKRRLIGELLPKEWDNLQSVGRLDKESEGLLFLTNDGDFSLKLTHPRYGLRKRYLVSVLGKLEPAVLGKFLAGIEDAGEILKVTKARLLSANNTRSVAELELAEGKNREIRRLFALVGLAVERLQRISIGPIKLGELPSGKWRILTETEIKSLLPKL